VHGNEWLSGFDECATTLLNYEKQKVFPKTKLQNIENLEFNKTFTKFNSKSQALDFMGN